MYKFNLTVLIEDSKNGGLTKKVLTVKASDKHQAMQKACEKLKVKGFRLLSIKAQY